jgi:hypothetical protein
MIRLHPVQLLAVLGALAAAPACSIDIHGSETSQREEKRFTVDTGEPVELEVRTFDGSIQVRSWDMNEVRVEIERRGPDQASIERLEVRTAQEGNRLVVDAVRPAGQGSVNGFGPWVVSQSVHFTVTAPRRLTLRAETGDGSVEASDLQGAIDLRSGDGGVMASRVEGQLTLRTGDGSILADNISGQVEADSGDGSIEIAGRLERLDVRTGDGSVRAEALSGSEMKDDWRVTTGDGRITFRVPQGFNAEVEAHTGDGRVRIEGLDSPVTEDQDGNRRDVRGRLGSGGRALYLRSGDGSIELSR